MSILASPSRNSQRTGISLHPAHYSNRPPGFIDASCVVCHAALFVPPGTLYPTCSTCKPDPRKYLSGSTAPEQPEATSIKFFRKQQAFSGSVSSPARELVARMLYAVRATGGQKDIELRSILAWFEREWEAARSASSGEREKWREEQRRLLEEAEYEPERWDGMD